MKYDELYKPHEKQLLIHRDKHRFRVLVCGRRFGKTILAVNELVVRALKEKSEFPFWYAAPTYRQAKNIAWRLLKKYTPPPIRDIRKDNETELSVQLYNGNVISLKGLENAPSLEGVGLSYFVGDEISAARSWEEVWQASIRPMLVDSGGGALFISKPRGYNHFHTMAKRGDHSGIIEGESIVPVTLDDDYMTYRFTTYDNPYIQQVEIEKAKNESSKEYFNQEYLARFTKYTGLVYKGFNRDTNVIDSFPIPDNWSIYGGVDFGSTNPTAYLWIAVDPDDNWFIISEHYATGKTIDYHAGIINSYPRRAIQTFGDPSGAQWISEFRDKGVFITPANKETGTSNQNWVNYGIEKVTEKLKSMPGHDVHLPERTLYDGSALYVFRECVNTLREFETYRWKEKLVGQASDLNEPDQPEKANDHALDALRYFAVSYKKQLDIPANFNVDNKDWSFK